MDGSILCNYIEKIYGYAVKRTFSRDEADELAQEILYTALKELPKLKNEKSFEPWLWGIANNMTKTFRRNMGKQRAIYSYDTLEDLYIYDDYDFIDNEIYEHLREKIAMLSSIYRDIIILYYYDSLSVKQISAKLGIPEGTVTWRLSEGRSKLKKECMDMNETALRPVNLQIRISGNGNYNGTTIPFPHTYIQDALSQNILYYGYLKPRTVEELAKFCGVPAYYIEDSISNLLYREAISEPSKGKYRTAFIIYNDEVDRYIYKARSLFDPLLDEFVHSLKVLTKETRKLGVQAAGKNDDELIYLYGLMALKHLEVKHNPVKFIEYPVRYDGYTWAYHATLLTKTSHSIKRFGCEASLNWGSQGCYSHYSYSLLDFSYRRMMHDKEINACEDILEGRKVTDIDSAASAIEAGYIIKDMTEHLSVTVPSFTKEQKEEFNKLSEKLLGKIITRYTDTVVQYISGYKELFPTHLIDDITRACNYMFVSLLATTIYPMAIEKGLLKNPSSDSVCDVLIQFK